VTAVEALRDQMLARLRRAVPFDAAFWATVDPTTLLFTAPYQEGIPDETVPYFIQNEFFDDDANKWTTLARDRIGVRTLVTATAGDLAASARYRDVFQPLGLGDELRAVLRVDGACWGYLCLHREAGTAFSRAEALLVRREAPLIADQIRTTVVSARARGDPPATGPGLVLITTDGDLVSMTESGERWLDELGRPEAELRMLAARGGRLRMRARSGRWAVLHASPLADTIAVIIEEPAPIELAPLLMAAHGLTAQEQVVTRLVCRGLSTRELSATLHISDNTVQDHLKSIFDKTGVRSRRELVATILQQDYLASGSTLVACDGD
jgi:DNA-binding CsgD family transcriptional regulator